MARRDRVKPKRRAPHPVWHEVQQTIRPAVKALVLVAILATGLTAWLMTYVWRSPYFRVSTIEVRIEPGQRWMTDPRIAYRVHPPVHLLQADLGGLAAAIRRDHPQLARVVVHRELPSRLVAQVALREPIGQIRGRQYYLVSADGMILAPGSSTAWGGLPVLMMGSRTAAYQPGQSCLSQEFRQAVAVLHDVQHSKALGARRISAVRVAQSVGSLIVTLVLDNGLEIRATPGDLAPRLARLADLLSGRHQEIEQAQYVDLRFDDLVVGLKGDD